MSTSYAEHAAVSPPRTEEIAPGIYAYVQPDGSWFLNNTGFLVGRRGIVSIDTTSTERRALSVRSRCRSTLRAPLAHGGLS